MHEQPLSRLAATSRFLRQMVANLGERALALALMAALCTSSGIGLAVLAWMSAQTTAATPGASPAYQLLVKSGNFRSGSEYAGRDDGLGHASTLKAEDAEALTQIDGIAAASPIVQTRWFVQAESLRAHMPLIGLAPDALPAAGWKLIEGRQFRTASTRETVIHEAAASKLFGSERDILHRRVTTRGESYTIVGIVAGDAAQFREPGLILPWQTLQSALGIGDLNAILVTLETSAHRSDTATKIRQLLRERHRLDTPSGSMTASPAGPAISGQSRPDDFSISTPVSQNLITGLPTSPADRASANMHAFTTALHAQLRRAFEHNRTTGMLIITLLGSGALLLIGASMANILLASLQRHRFEIGLRLSLGASHRDIYTQQLTAALIPVASGALAGLLLASAVTALFDTGFRLSILTVLSYGALGAGSIIAASSIIAALAVRRALRCSPILLLRSS